MSTTSPSDNLGQRILLWTATLATTVLNKLGTRTKNFVLRHKTAVTVTIVVVLGMLLTPKSFDNAVGDVINGSIGSFLFYTTVLSFIGCGVLHVLRVKRVASFLGKLCRALLGLMLCLFVGYYAFEVLHAVLWDFLEFVGVIVGFILALAVAAIWYPRYWKRIWKK